MYNTIVQRQRYTGKAIIDIIDADVPGTYVTLDTGTQSVRITIIFLSKSISKLVLHTRYAALLYCCLSSLFNTSTTYLLPKRTYSSSSDSRLCAGAACTELCTELCEGFGGGSRSAEAVTSLRRVFWWQFSHKTPGGRKTSLDQQDPCTLLRKLL